MATTVTLTAEPEGTPSPYVDVLVDDFDGGISTVTVWRTQEGRSFRVRGLVRVSTGGTVTIRDYEAPMGQEISYRAEQFDSGGDFVSWSATETVTLPEGLLETAYFHNPFDPSTAVQTVMHLDAADPIVRPADAEQYKPLGRSLPIIVSLPRRGVTAVKLNCSTSTTAAGTALDSMFGGYDDSTVPIVCVRTHPDLGLPGTLFAYVDRPTKRLFNARQGGEIVDWYLTGDEVSPPVEAVVTVLLDYADFTAFYTGGYNLFTAAYSDYQEATRDYSIAGTA